jgi:hypothetical protein
MRLERLGEGLAVCSGETVAAHWIDEPESLVPASEMGDTIQASADEPYLGF